MDITLGSTVTVSASTERWFTEVRAGRALLRGGTQAAAVGFFAHVQLLNPVGSGKQMLVRQAQVGPGSNFTMSLNRYDTALATLVGAGVNLLVGGAAGQGQVRTENNAAQLGTNIGAYNAGGNANVYPAPDWYYELSPGQGMLFVMDLVNARMTVTYYWLEL